MAWACEENGGEFVKIMHEGRLGGGDVRGRLLVKWASKVSKY